MLEELGLPYRLEMLPFPPRFAQRSYLDINPLGTVPQRELRFVRDGAGRFVSTAPLIPGRWQITATVRSGGHQVRVAQPASL